MSSSVTFFSGVGTVTGANFLLEGEGFRALIDCGMLQGLKEAESFNKADFPYNPDSIDFLFVTHAHIDHIGRIPKLVKDGFRGTIFSTAPTKELAELMLADAARIADSEARANGTLPPYTTADVTRAFSLWKTLSYHAPHTVSKNLSVTLKDAGHILGSSMFLFSITEKDGNKKTILFTGDLGNSPSTLVKDTEFVNDADYIVIDSVYGDRNHEPKDVREKRFVEIIKETISRKGTLVIPAFSLERAQIIVYQINNLVESGAISPLPVFLDSPLAIRLTDIYERMIGHYNDEVKRDIQGGDKIFHFPKFKETARVAESQHIESVPSPKIIIAGSGMSTAGRVVDHEARYLPNPNNTILLMGYQAIGTLGRKLEEGMKEVVIHEEKVQVRARIENISGYSAHKDSDALVDFIEKALGRLKKVFVVMGEPKSSLFLAQRLRDNFNIEVVVPEKGNKGIL